jgi:hypothetical protein
VRELPSPSCERQTITADLDDMAMAHPERISEGACSDKTTYKSAEAAIRQMICELATRQARLDLAAREAANDNSPNHLTKTAGELK